MLGNEVSIGQAAMVCLISMLVIFAVLFLISVMIDILAFSLKRKKGKNQPATPAALMAVPVATQDGDTDIAVITAAAAAYLSRNFSICWNQYWSSSLTKVMALPSRLARAVRPMR